MSTYATWLIRFPQFSSISETVFNVFLGDAILEMGSEESRWYDMYTVAQDNLIAHFVSTYQKYLTGDNSPLQPIRTKQVDDVMVEYAVSRDLRDNFDAYQATSYGQQYLKWRRMAFAGPRML